ncbi:hypothetical protein [Stutzerimonas nitrititolerans]|uniref:hypothetical protein n=1 Tax=Stutzerimonas nitrititolerans TaxID=2482751 RepID=UPI00289AF2D9|nr:hypothetical protein [Stutzerimonas nitrititolerans]
MIFKAAGVGLLLFLVVFNIIFIFFLVFLLKFGVALFFYVSSGEFRFMWDDAFIASAKGGGATGGVLGLGMWLMTKLEEKRK